MFANLKTMVAVLVVVTAVEMANAEPMPRVVPGLSPLSALYYAPKDPAPDFDCPATPRPDYRAHTPLPPIQFPAINQFWPRGNDDLLSLNQIDSHRRFLWQSYNVMLTDLRVPVEHVMATYREWQYWDQLFNWKIARDYRSYSR